MASTLTPEQIAQLQRDLGDECANYDSTALQLAWDAANGNYCGTLAILWREIYMKAKPVTIAVANGGTALSQANIRAAKEKMEFWQACAGTAGGTLSIGSLNLGIDARADSEWG